MSTKSRPDIVPSRKSVTEDIPSIKSASEVIRSRTKIVQSTNEAILSRKSTMIKSILKDETFDKVSRVDQNKWHYMTVGVELLSH